MKQIYSLLIVLFTLSNLQHSIAQQAGTADPTFNVADSSMRELRAGINNVVITLANGKILAGGYRLVRFYESGYVDNSFFICEAASITSLQEQSDGKVLVGGTFTVYNDQNVANLIRGQSQFLGSNS